MKLMHVVVNIVDCLLQLQHKFSNTMFHETFLKNILIFQVYFEMFCTVIVMSPFASQQNRILHKKVVIALINL